MDLLCIPAQAPYHSASACGFVRYLGQPNDQRPDERNPLVMEGKSHAMVLPAR